MLAVIGIFAFLIAMVAFETAMYFFDWLPAIRQRGVLHGTLIFIALMVLTVLVGLAMDAL